MARAPRPRPALACNFRVELGRGADASAISQVVLPRFATQPVAGEAEPLLALRRAASDDRLFHNWWEEARNGRGKARVVTVTMLAADMTPIFAWRFTGARPAALGYGLIDATLDGLLDETLEIAFERMERV